jgi:hypothetical protein
MTKRIELTQEDAEKLLGKPVAAGKKRRSEIEHDTELEDKLTEKIGVHKVKKREPEHDTKIGGGALRGIMTETIARVYEEMWPGMQVRGHNDEPDREIAEEAYILSLTMVVGNQVELPRKPLKIREAEISGSAVFCWRHS